MKINKQLIEQKLTEAEEEQAVVITAADSEKEAADKIESEASEENVEVNPKEIVAAADKIDADTSVVDLADDTGLGVENVITRALDKCLRSAQRYQKNGIRERANILICGLPGSGKTASVYDWAKHAKGNDGRLVHVEYLNMKNNDLDAYINGYTVKKDNEMSVTQAFSSNLDGLDTPNSILLLDEYNRQTRDQIRASALTLINEHYIVGDSPDRRRYFPNFLFTIAIMNPSVPSDPGAAKLNDAEKSRFVNTLMHQDSDPITTREFLTKQYTKQVRDELTKENPDYDEIEYLLRIMDLGLFIVNDPSFAYDTEDDLYTLEVDNKNMLNQRALTSGLAFNEGDKDEFLDWLDYGSNFLDRDVELLKDIVQKYVPKSRAQLFAEAGISSDGTETDVQSDAAVTGQTDSEAEVELEDDDDFFGQGAAQGVQKSAAEVAKAIDDLLASW